MIGIILILVAILLNSATCRIVIESPASLTAENMTQFCSLDLSISGGLMIADKHCTIQKYIGESTFEKALEVHNETFANNYHDQVFFSVKFLFRYKVLLDRVDSSFSDFNVILEVSQGDDITVTTDMKFLLQRSNEGIMAIIGRHLEWSTFSTTFQRSPLQQLPTIVSIRPVEDSNFPSGLDGYLEVSNISIEHFPQSTKYLLKDRNALHESQSTVTCNQCSLLGNINALVLNDITIAAPSTASLFCGVYSIEKNHHRVKAERDTWGRKCSAFLAFSDVADETIPAINIPHLGIESYGNIWQKVRSVLKYIHHHYIDEYEYFLIGGDDMYYIMENLYAYLNSDEIRIMHEERKGLYLGREFAHNGSEVMYNTGGPGYILNRAALKTLVSGLNRCNAKVFAPCEDVYVAFCLLHLGGMTPYNTSDSQNRPRWHNLPPGYVIQPEPPNDRMRVAYLGRDIHLRYGQECCSRESVAFHCLQPDLMKMIDDYLYRCPPEEKHQYYAKMGSDYYDAETKMTMINY